MRLPNPIYNFKLQSRVVLTILCLGLLMLEVSAGLAKTNLSGSSEKVQIIKEVDGISSRLISSCHRTNDFFVFFFVSEKENINEEEKRNLTSGFISNCIGLSEIKSAYLISFCTSSPPIKDLSLAHLSTIVFLN